MEHFPDRIPFEQNAASKGQQAKIEAVEPDLPF